jgi:cell division protein FtsB
MQQPRRTYRMRWFRLTVLLIVGYSMYVLVNQQLEINAVKRETEATRSRMEQMKQLNQSYVDEKVRLTTPAYVEKLAREELGLAKPGEIPYIPAGKN